MPNIQCPMTYATPSFFNQPSGLLQTGKILNFAPALTE